jgi:hypothetical protein
MQAQVVGTALKQCSRHRTPDRFTNQWQVPVVQLILQCLGSCADNRLAAAQQRRQKIGKSLARARPGLDHEAFRAGDGLRHCLGHPRLAGAGLESGQMGLKRAMRSKKFGEVGHGARLTVTATDAHRFFTQKSPLYGMSACEGLSAKYNCAPTPAVDIIGQR